MKTNRRDRRRGGLLIAGLLVVAAIAAAVLGAITAVRGPHSTHRQDPRLQTTAVIRTTLVTTARFHGSVGFTVGRTVNDPAGGTITALPSAGRTVRRGQPLYWVNDQPVVVFYGNSALFRKLRVPAADTDAGDDRDLPPAPVVAARQTLQAARRQIATDQLTLHQAALQQATSGRATLLQASTQLHSDRLALAAARRELTADEQLGCPAASSTTVGTPSAPPSGPTSDGSSTAGSGGGSNGPGGALSSSGSSSAKVRHAHDTSGSDTTPQTGTTTPQTGTTTPRPTAPSVANEQDSGETTTTATLSAQIVPGGSDTHYYFEYGTSTAYGSSSVSADAGSGDDPVQVSALLTGLRADTSYVYALVATNAGGTTFGTSETFTTASSSCAAQHQTITADRQAIAQDLLASRGDRAAVGGSTQSDRHQVQSDEAVARADAQALRRAERAVPHRTVTDMRGADVALVAQNLAALGYYSGSTAKANVVAYTRTLAAAVRRWQAAVGIEPTGALAPDQVVILPGPTRIAAIHGIVGGHASSPVLSLSGTAKLVNFHGSGDLRRGQAVRIAVPGATPATGRIRSVSPDGNALAAQATIDNPAALPASKSAVVTVTTERRPRVLAVPVEALVARPGGGYALQLPGGYQLRVRVGLITGDLAEVSANGLRAGMQVVTAA